MALSKIAITSSTSPQAALRAARQLLGQWPHAKPADPETYAASLGAVLAQYPLGVVQECVDPRVGLAREREFPPTVACLVEWCDKRLKYHTAMASYVPLPVRKEQEFSDEHRLSMISRLQKLMHEIFDKPAEWVRPIGAFEKRDDKWNRLRPAPLNQETTYRRSEAAE